MAKSLIDLFKTKPLTSQDGKTAEEAYEIRDSKKIRISSNNILVDNTGFAAARLVRKQGIGRLSETALEQELTGVRIIRAASGPVLYGNETARITLRSTPALDLMKGNEGGGLIGKQLTSVRNTINSKLGIPELLIPTNVKDKLSDTTKYNLSFIQNRMEDLADIRGSAEGSVVGNFLKDIRGGTPSVIGKQALGSLITLGKDKVRGVLFGTTSTTPFTNATMNRSGTNLTFNYGSLDDIGTITSLPDGNTDAAGTRYSNTIRLTRGERSDSISFINEDEASMEGGLLGKSPDLDIDTTITFSKTPERIPKFSEKAKAFEYDKSKFMDSARGMTPIYDVLNRSLPYRVDNKFGQIKPNGYDKTLEELDFIPLRFEFVDTKGVVNFRATISGLQETFSPSWDSNKFIGSPFNYYTYSGIERSIGFSFKVYSLDADEHKAAWKRLNFLTSMVYPVRYVPGGNAVVPPFIYFTLGDMYRNREGFIESLSYTYDDESPWQITDKEPTVMRKSLSTLGILNTSPNTDTEVDMKNYKLPMVIDVSITIKILDTRSNTSKKQFYTFNPQT